MKDFTDQIISCQSDNYSENCDDKIFETGREVGVKAVTLKHINLDFLTTIHIFYSYFNQDFTIQLCELLKRNKTVSYLSLESNINLGDFEAGQLGDMLLENKCLRTLDISANNITDLGMSSIIGSLYTNETLTQLVTVNNNFTINTVKDFLAALKINKSLHKVLLGTPRDTTFMCDQESQQEVQGLILDCLSTNFKICYLDLVKNLTKTNVTRDIYLKLNRNNNLHYYYPERFLLTPEELTERVLIPLKNLKLEEKLPTELRKNIFSFLGVSFRDEVKAWKKQIIPKLEIFSL